MSETTSDLPNKDIRRNTIAKQIREIRNIERARLYETERDGIKYIQKLLGVLCLFDYVRRLGSTSLILDIGAGSTSGIYDLSTSSLGAGLLFEATVLSRNPALVNYLPNKQIHVTSVERLRGIKDASVGGVLGVYSVGYSDEPALAITSLDRVLVPGGVFKGTFHKKPTSPDEAKQNPFGFKEYDQFRDAFSGFGYDTAVENNGASADILLAIKPDGPEQVKAASLLEADKKTVKNQIVIVTREKMQRGKYNDLLK